MKTDHITAPLRDAEEETNFIARCLDCVLAGGELTEDCVYSLASISTAEGVAALRDAAAEVTRRFGSDRFDSCSIVNARSGRCPENCKWCAQSAHYNTSCDVYDVIDRDTCLDAARLNSRCGISRV